MLTHSQAHALVAYAKRHGRTWKHQLLMGWMNGKDLGPELRLIRNNHGPEFIKEARIDRKTGIIYHPMFHHGYFASDTP